MELCISIGKVDYVRVAKERKSHKCDLYKKGFSCSRECADLGILKSVRKDASCFLKFRYQGETVKFSRDECLRRFSLRSLISKTGLPVKLDSFRLSREAVLIVGKYKLNVPAGWHIIISESGMRCLSDKSFNELYTRSEKNRNFYSDTVKIHKEEVNEE